MTEVIEMHPGRAKRIHPSFGWKFMALFGMILFIQMSLQSFAEEPKMMTSRPTLGFNRIVEENDSLRVEINAENGLIDYLGATGHHNNPNFIAGYKELAAISGDVEWNIEGFGSMWVGYRTQGKETAPQWLRFGAVEGEALAFRSVGDSLTVTRHYKVKSHSLIMEIEVVNSSEFPVEITDLALSTPINNDYSAWRHDQRYLYDNKMTEHIFPGGENGYHIVEPLNGRGPRCTMIPLGHTRLEYVKHYPGTVDRAPRPGIVDHSWPGSTMVYLQAGGYLDRNNYQPIIPGVDATVKTIAPGGKATYQLAFAFTGTEAQWRDLLIKNGKLMATSLPAMSGPIDSPFHLIVYGHGKLDLRSDDHLKIIRSEKINGGRLWDLRFDKTGVQSVIVEREHGESLALTYYITDTLPVIFEKRAEFITTRQVFREEKNPLDGAILSYCNGFFDGREFKGLLVKEEDLWGNGSYEGGITDAMFAAEKNAIDPNPGQIARLDDYIDQYVRRYLQDPQTSEVMWWCGDFTKDRAYNYQHVMNFYISMYKISKRYGHTRYEPWQYLDWAYCTVATMYEKSRKFDLVVGGLGPQGLREMIGFLKDEMMVIQSVDLEVMMSRQFEYLFMGDVPYGSECAYDNTGYAWVAMFADKYNQPQTLRDLAKVIFAVRGNQPAWWWQGSDIRWWDAGTDFRECCHHYTSPHNSDALIKLINDNVYDVTPETMALIYGGLLGSTAKIHNDGRASMSYCWEQESKIFGFNDFTGDVGLSLFGTLSGLGATVFDYEDLGLLGCLCDLDVKDKGNGFVLKPAAGADRKVLWHLQDSSLGNGHVMLNTGSLKSLDWDETQGMMTLKIRADKDARSPLRIELKGDLHSRWATCNDDPIRVTEKGEAMVEVVIDAKSVDSEFAIKIALEPLAFGSSKG